MPGACHADHDLGHDVKMVWAASVFRQPLKAQSFENGYVKSLASKATPILEIAILSLYEWWWSVRELNPRQAVSDPCLPYVTVTPPLLVY